MGIYIVALDKMQNMNIERVIVIKVVGELLFLYGVLGWTYGVVINVTHPEWLRLPLSHLTLWLRTDIFIILSFFISEFGFFMWRLTSELQTRTGDFQSSE